MTSIVGTIQEIVRHEMREIRVSELGVVEAIAPHKTADDRDNYGCDVRLKNSGLVLKGVPVATGHIGTAAIPNIGDLVLLAFDRGDVNQAFIVGRLYTDGDRPPLNDANEVIFRLPLAKDDSATIKAAIRNHPEKSPPRELIVEMAPKITLRIVDGIIRATAGKTELALDQSGESGGTVTVFAGATKIVMNQDGDITVEALGAISVKATGALRFDAQSITMSSETGVTIDAATELSLSGAVSAAIDGGASVSVQGAVISVSGITSFGP